MVDESDGVGLTDGELDEVREGGANVPETETDAVTDPDRFTVALGDVLAVTDADTLGDVETLTDAVDDGERLVDGVVVVVLTPDPDRLMLGEGVAECDALRDAEGDAESVTVADDVVLRVAVIVVEADTDADGETVGEFDSVAVTDAESETVGEVETDPDGVDCAEPLDWVEKVLDVDGECDADAVDVIDTLVDVHGDEDVECDGETVTVGLTENVGLPVDVCETVPEAEVEEETDAVTVGVPDTDAERDIDGEGVAVLDVPMVLVTDEVVDGETDVVGEPE